MEHAHRFYLLIVDDDAIDMRRIRDAVKSAFPEGLHISEATSVDIAKAHIAKNPTDLAIVDMDMPPLYGIEAARSLREIRPDLPLVCVSVVRDPALKVAVMALGGACWLCKDDEAELPRAITETIERMHYRRRYYADIADRLDAIHTLASNAATRSDVDRLCEQQECTQKKVEQVHGDVASTSRAVGDWNRQDGKTVGEVVEENERHVKRAAKFSMAVGLAFVGLWAKWIWGQVTGQEAG